jgi:hypothetical protein
MGLAAKPMENGGSHLEKIIIFCVFFLQLLCTKCIFYHIFPEIMPQPIA